MLTVPSLSPGPGALGTASGQGWGRTMEEAHAEVLPCPCWAQDASRMETQEVLVLSAEPSIHTLTALQHTVSAASGSKQMCVYMRRVG